jgi:AcrR family transcriptional regulator
MRRDGVNRAPLDAVPFDTDDSPPGRILRVARELFLARTFSGLTMEALAHELGISKKTLYAHFSSKDVLLVAIIEATGRTIRRQVDGLLNDPSHSFMQKLRGVLRIVGLQFSMVTPNFVRDLQRFAPTGYRHLREMREHNMPLVFGRLFRIGVTEGMVRDDLDVDLLVEFWLQTMHGMQQPAVMERTGLTPRATFEKGFELFFLGVLTAKGRADHRRRPE